MQEFNLCGNREMLELEYKIFESSRGIDYKDALDDLIEWIGIEDKELKWVGSMSMILLKDNVYKLYLNIDSDKGLVVFGKVEEVDRYVEGMGSKVHVRLGRKE